MDAVTGLPHIDIVPERGDRIFEIPRESDMEV